MLNQMSLSALGIMSGLELYLNVKEKKVEKRGDKLSKTNILFQFTCK